MSPQQSKRLVLVKSLRAKGKTLREIGEVVGLTRERVRQLLADLPGRVRHCRCGCGTVLTLRYQQYVAGHRPGEQPRYCRCGCGGVVPSRKQYLEGHRPSA